MAAVCNVVLLGVGNETKRAYVSFDGAHSWTRRGAPGEGGYIGELAAGTSDNWVLAEERTEFATTIDEGGTWTYTGPHVELTDGAGDTQFVSAFRAVAIPAFNPDGIVDLRVGDHLQRCCPKFGSEDEDLAFTRAGAF